MLNTQFVHKNIENIYMCNIMYKLSYLSVF